MRKFISLTTIGLVVFAYSAGTSFAQSVSPTEGTGSMNGKPGAIMQKNNQLMQNRIEDTISSTQETKAGNLQERAEKEITRRIDSLKQLQTKIASFKRLSEDQKTELTKEIQTEIDSLTALQTQISSNTDPLTLKTDVQSIITAHRIYAFFMPKVTILSAAERILTGTDQMTIFAGKLETRISEAKAQGKDVTAWEKDLADVKAKIASSEAAANDAWTLVSPLKPDGFPGNKTTLVTAREKLKIALADLLSAKEMAMLLLKAITAQDISGTPGVTQAVASPTTQSVMQ